MATLKDIAKYTSFSVSTVSVVLRGDAAKFGICEETADTIRRAAVAMGYVRNDYARIMAGGKSRVLAFITNTGRNVEYHGKLLSGALEEASTRGYSLRIFNYAAQSESDLLLDLLSFRIDGVLLSGDLLGDTIKKLITYLQQYNIYCATVNHSNQIFGVGAESDDIAGMTSMVEYLFKNGHRKIAYFGLISQEEYSKKRLNGYYKGVEKFGLHPYVYEYSQDVRLQEIVKKGITAIVGESDYIGASLLQQAYSESINIPEDISVCGFAGMEVSTFAARPMTTVEQDFVEMGRSAAKLLINILENPDVIQERKIINTTIETKLKIQKTTDSIG